MGAVVPWIIRGLSALGLVQIGQNMSGSDDEKTGPGLLTTIGAISFAALALFAVWVLAFKKLK